MSTRSELLVSIVITSYNYADYLSAAIDSALAQTYSRLEVIVVDDGSTDNSLALIKNYGSRLVCIAKDNAGEASAMNSGFAAALGDIVLFLDSDDVLLPEAASEVAQAFTDQPTAAKVQYRMAVIDETGTLTGDYRPPLHVMMPSGDLKTTLLDGLDYRGPPTSGTAFSRTALLQIMPVPAEIYRTNTDIYLQNMIVPLGPVVVLDKICAYYRVHGRNNYNSHVVSVKVMKSDILCLLDCDERLAHISRSNGWDSKGCLVKSTQFVIKTMLIAKIEKEDWKKKQPRLARAVLNGLGLSWKQQYWTLSHRLLNALWFLLVLASPSSFVMKLAEARLQPK